MDDIQVFLTGYSEPVLDLEVIEITSSLWLVLSVQQGSYMIGSECTNQENKLVSYKQMPKCPCPSYNNLSCDRLIAQVSM